MVFVHILLAALLLFSSAHSDSPPVNTVVCNGKTYIYQELSGSGVVPSDVRDKYGDTASLGSSIAIERKSWKKTGRGQYKGTIWMLPDRGWNTLGTTGYQPRIHKFQITLNTTLESIPSPPNLNFHYLDTILFSDPLGNPISGLDPTTVLSFPGFPDLPAATFPGDGFSTDGGPGGTRVSLDPEGLVLDTHAHSVDGFWISDEYGPFIYHFDASGKLLQAIRPADAFIPIRNGVESFSANSPPIYNLSQFPVPRDPSSGRTNNQGFEGLTSSRNTKDLYALAQSALVQDGGLTKLTNRYARLVKYDISKTPPTYTGEYVVPLPQFVDPSQTTNPRTAAQSEILSISSKQFLVLARDSGAGQGGTSPLSLYRHIDVFDISSATAINKPAFDSRGSSITTSNTSGVLKAPITPAKYCTFLDVNNNAQLAKFGLHNGGQEAGLLNEKWEGLAIVPADGEDGGDGWWFLFATSDNDFITQNGFFDFGEATYHDKSGNNIDNQALVFKVKLPIADD